MNRYLRSFLPWIAFAVISTGSDSRYGALAGFLLALRQLRSDRRAGRAWDELVIETSSAVFFGGLAFAAYTVDRTPMGVYGTAGSVAWLALTAWVSLGIRRPFTLGIARTMAPAHVHNTRAFFHVNAVITAVWATAFTLNAAALALLVHVAPGNTAALIAAKVAGFVLPAAFTSWYPKAAAARRAATAQGVALHKDPAHV
jgi:hypothetical protein